MTQKFSETPYNGSLRTVHVDVEPCGIRLTIGVSLTSESVVLNPSEALEVSRSLSKAAALVKK